MSEATIAELFADADDVLRHATSVQPIWTGFVDRFVYVLPSEDNRPGEEFVITIFFSSDEIPQRYTCWRFGWTQATDSATYVDILSGKHVSMDNWDN